MSTKKIKIKKSHFWSLSIFFFIAIYEIVFFFRPAWYTSIIDIYKLVFPFTLFLVFVKGQNGIINIKSNPLKFYIFFYFFLLLWMIFISPWTENLFENIQDWLKHIPRFFLIVGLYFSLSNSNIKYISNKLIILFGLFTFFQYIFLNLFGPINISKFYGIPFAGPFKIFGKIVTYYLPTGELFYRLCGFFNEPSNASAYLFCSFFISKQIKGNQKFWSYSGFTCLIGGFFCLSNAGYIAFSFAFLVGILINSQKFILLTFFKIILGSSLMIFGIFGRYYLQENILDVKVLNVMSGYRNEKDFSAGRLDKIDYTFKTVLNNPFGEGFIRIDKTKTPPPAGAPFLWLLMGGLPAIFFLFLRESAWAFIVLKRPSLVIYEAQALIVILIQQSIYGQWNNGLYYFCVASLFCKYDNFNIRK
jgi:hypothetical protein